MTSMLPASLTESRCERHGIWLLLVLTVLLYLPGLGTLPMMDRDEPRFAHATVEMMQRGTWTVPYFNGGYRFDKPPLTYWWMRLHYHLFGIHEFAARLHSVVATWLVALTVFSFGKRLSGARAGLLAGGAWLLTLQVLLHGRLCVADMPMVLCVGLAMRAVLELMMTPSASFTRWHGLLYVALGLGFLAKGPIAWMVPALALVLYRFVLWRQPIPWASLHAGKGVLLTLGIVGAWGIPALMETHGLFWKVGMGEHVVARGASAFNGRFPVPGYYFATALASLFPWIALLPQAWRSVRKQWNATTALLVSWLLAPYVIFTCYATQLAHYVMPGFPAAVILLAVCGADFTGPRWHRWWSGAVIGLFAVLAIIALSGSRCSNLPEALHPLLLHGGLLLLLLALLGCLVVWNASQKRSVAFVGLMMTASCLPALFAALMRDLRTTHPAAQLAEQMATMPAATELMAWQFTEPSLVFHFNHEWKFTSKLEAVTRQLDRQSSGVIVLLRREWTLSKALRSADPERDYRHEVDALVAGHPKWCITRVNGFNAARSSWVELVVLSQSSNTRVSAL